MADSALLSLRDVKVFFPITSGLLINRTVGWIRAVNGVSFDLAEGETLGLVGESGCGKSTTAKAILQLNRPTAGDIHFEGKNLAALRGEPLRIIYRKLQVIYQDPYASLNPRMTVGQIVGEAITCFGLMRGAELRKRVGELLETVGLDPRYINRYPHEFSGGQRQRIGIARALAVNPAIIICDEPVSALDVSIQAQVVNLLRDLQKRLGLSYLFISHDLRVVELISHKVAVMYLGKIVEMGLSDRIANKASHPYTHILWSSLLEKQSKETAQKAKSVQAGRWGVFDFERPTAGCRFVPRCPVYESNGKPTLCTDPATEPQLKDIGGAHQVACHFPL